MTSNPVGTIDGEKDAPAEPIVLDPASGSRMFYFDKADPRVLFGDIRSEQHVLSDGRALNITPDAMTDFRVGHQSGKSAKTHWITFIKDRP